MSTSVGQLTIDMAANVLKLQKDMEASRAVVEKTMGAIESAAGFAQKALFGLGAGLSAAAFASFIKGSIEAADRLHDLSLTAGMSVEGLSGLASVGKYSGRTVEDIATAAQKLAKGLSATTEEGKGAAIALKTIGINFDEFKRMKSEDQFLAISKSLDKYADGQGKVAVAQALFGKSGAQMLPMLKDLAAVGELQAKITSQQADMADHLSDNMLRVTTSGEAWKKQIAMGMLPALDELVQAFLDVSNGPGGIKAEIAKLAADGSITKWTRGAIEALTYLVDGFQYVQRAVTTTIQFVTAMWVSTIEGFQSFGTAIAQIQTGKISAAFNTIKLGVEQQKAIWSGFSNDVSSTWGTDTFGSKIRARMGEIQAVGTEAKKTGAFLDFTNVLEKSGKEAEKLMQQFTTLVQRITGKDTGVDPDFINNLKLLATQGAKAGMTLAQIIDLQEKYINQQPYMTKAAEARKKENEEAAEAYEKLLKASQDNVDHLQKETEKELDAARAIGLTKTQVAALEAAKLDEMAVAKERKALVMDEIDLSGQLSRSLRDEAAAYRAKAAAVVKRADVEQAYEDDKKKLEEQKEILKSIDDTAHDVWTNIWKGGSDVWKKLKDTAKTVFFDWLYQMVIRKWVLNISANVLGMGGNAASSLLGSAGNSLLSNVGSSMMSTFAPPGGMIDSVMGMFGGGSGIGGMAASSAEIASTVEATSGMLLEAGATATEAAAAAAELGGSMAATGGMMSGVMGALSAIPVWGWAAMAVLAIIGSGAFSGETRSGGQYGYSTNGSTVYNARRDRTQAASGIGATFLEGPSGGDPHSAQAVGMINANVLGLNQAFIGMGMGTRVTGYQAGYESSEKGRGGVFAGGTLSTGQTFGESGKGDNYAGTLFEDTSTKSPGVEEAFKNFTTDMYQSAIQALQVAGGLVKTQSSTVINKSWMQMGEDYGQEVETATTVMERIYTDAATEAASGMPQVIRDLLRGVNAEALSDADAQALVTKIQTIITGVQQFGAAAAAWPVQAIKGLSFDLTASLLDLMGGLQNALTMTSTYIDNFYSDSEKRAVVVAGITKVLDAAGSTLTQGDIASATRAQFRALVDAQDLTTESGQVMYAALMQVSSAFAAITDPIGAVAQAVDDATGTIVGAAGNLAEANAKAQADWAKQSMQIMYDNIGNAVKNAQDNLDSLQKEYDAAAKAEQARKQANAAAFEQQADNLRKIKDQYMLTGRNTKDTAAITSQMLAQATPANAQQAAASFMDSARNSATSQLDYILRVAQGRGTLESQAKTQEDMAQQALTENTGALDSLTEALHQAARGLGVAQYNQATFGQQFQPGYQDMRWVQGMMSQADSAGMDLQDYALMVAKMKGEDSIPQNWVDLYNKYQPQIQGNEDLWNQLVPSYDVGTSWVPHDGPAMLHAGEAVLTRSENADRISGDQRVVSLLESMDNRLATVEDENKRMRVVLDGIAQGTIEVQTSN